MANLLLGSATAGIRFGRAVMMVRGAAGVAQSVHFYQNALGMHVTRHTDDWAELICGIPTTSSNNDDDDDSSSSKNNNNNNNNTTTTNNYAVFRLSIKAVECEAQLSTGYTPFLSFDVEDMNSVVAKCVQMGGQLDGPIQYPAHGKVAALRAPDGHMIGLYEPST